MRTPKLPAGKRVRIALISDLHVLYPTRVLKELPRAIEALQPDLVIFAGDAIGRHRALPLFREILGSLPATHGRYAVRGNHDVWYFSDADLFGGGVATELRGTATVAAGLVLCGAEYDRTPALQRCLASRPEGFRVVVNHSPDAIEDLAPLGADLYVAGHTHGGQVRLPFYGALMTMSRFDKAYEMGTYRVRDTTLFVTRGVGFEPPPAPQVRFLCPPEIGLIDVIGEGEASAGR
ncbi:MAG: metallophosphoesterase [Myxococcota bacterium]